MTSRTTPEPPADSATVVDSPDVTAPGSTSGARPGLVPRRPAPGQVLRSLSRRDPGSGVLGDVARHVRHPEQRASDREQRGDRRDPDPRL